MQRRLSALFVEAPGFNYVSKSLTEFARCIRDGSAYPISASDVLHGVAVLEAAIQSAATKNPSKSRTE